MAFWTYQILNGLSFGMLLFLSAAGLALIFGVMRVLNLAHGAFYAMAAWTGSWVARQSESLLLAIVVGVVVSVATGILFERLLRRVPREELPQALMTFGLMLVLGDLALWIWGGTPQTVPRPDWLSGAVRIAGVPFPAYRLFVIAIGLLVGVFLWYVQVRTRVGAAIRAAIDDAEMARSIGIDVSLLASATFAVGAGLAGLGGLVGAPIVGVHVGTELDILLLSFVVVIIGGLGSLKGAFVGAVIVGFLDSVGKALLPDFALFTLFVPMALILVVRPTGLFGREV